MTEAETNGGDSLKPPTRKSSLSLPGRLSRLAHNHPSKSYTFSYIAGDLCMIFAGFALFSSPYWALAAGIALTSNLIKLRYATGSDGSRSGKSVASVLKESFMDALKLISRPGDYRKIILAYAGKRGEKGTALSGYRAEYNQRDPGLTLKDKFFRSVKKPSVYPVDFGFILYSLAGAAYMAEGFASGNPAQIAMGGFLISGSSTAFTTENMDYAARFFNMATVTLAVLSVSALIADPLNWRNWLPLGATFSYMIGNYFMAQVDTENQSAALTRQIVDQQHPGGPPTPCN